MRAKRGSKSMIYLGKKELFLLSFLLLAVTACAALVVVHYVVRGGAGSPEGLAADPNARIGSLNLSQEERLAALQKVVDEGMVNFSINATPYFRNAASEGNISVENMAGSQNRFTVKIILDETGQTIYESGLIQPEQYIEYARLTASLAPGAHECTAYFTTYALDEERYIGQAGAKITVHVDNLP